METKRRASLDHLNLSVRDYEESAAWYAKFFDFVVVERGVDEDGPWGILRNGDSMLCIYERARKTSPDTQDVERLHRISHFGLRITDRAQWDQVLRESKVRTYYGSPLRYPHSTSWYVTDPTGYMIEVALWDADQVRFSETG